MIFTFPSFVISAIFCTEAAELSIAIFKTPVSVLFILPVLELVLFKFIVPLFVITASAVVDIEPEISAVTFSSITRLAFSFTFIMEFTSLFNPLPIETLCEPVIFEVEYSAAKISFATLFAVLFANDISPSSVFNSIDAALYIAPPLFVALLFINSVFCSYLVPLASVFVTEPPLITKDVPSL